MGSRDLIWNSLTELFCQISFWLVFGQILLYREMLSFSEVSELQAVFVLQKGTKRLVVISFFVKLLWLRLKSCLSSGFIILVSCSLSDIWHGHRVVDFDSKRRWWIIWVFGCWYEGTVEERGSWKGCVSGWVGVRRVGSGDSEYELVMREAGWDMFKW